MYIKESELIFNPDGSIYHLNLHPHELAERVILVGDPDRVGQVSCYFERVDVRKQRREFVTHTGELHGQRISVVSTGIGVGSIDIVMNELDALVNIDFKTRQPKAQLTQLQLLRMGTCGALQESVALHDLIYSEYALAFDGLLSFYDDPRDADEQAVFEALMQHFVDLPVLPCAYVAKASLPLHQYRGHRGMTLTCSGFYGPQCRRVRAPLMTYDFFKYVQNFRFQNLPILNFEMETAAILALGNMLGHRCASMSVVVANRVTQQFSDNVGNAVMHMIDSLITDPTLFN